jgi:hypothetical protein
MALKSVGTMKSAAWRVHALVRPAPAARLTLIGLQAAG